jgi:competence protein ComEA
MKSDASAISRALASLAILSSLWASAQAGPVNINTADAATLASELKGIGLKRAQSIIDYRVKHGPFKTADELSLVKGIGPAVIQKNRADIRTDSKPAAPAATTTTGRTVLQKK